MVREWPGPQAHAFRGYGALLGTVPSLALSSPEPMTAFRPTATICQGGRQCLRLSTVTLNWVE